MTRPEWPKLGATFDNGAFATTELLAGHWARGRWRGVRVADGAAVLIGTRTVSEPLAMIGRFQYTGPGVAPLLFAGPPDRETPLVRANKQLDFAAIELEPRGTTLESLATKLALEDVVRIGIGLADAISLASREGRVIGGVRPEVTYAERDDDGWRFSGVAPAGYNLVRHELDDGGTAFELGSFQPPEIWDDERNAKADVFSVALVLWHLVTGAHAYSNRPARESNIEEDRRERWTGPPALGSLLERALVADPDQRIAIDEFGIRLRDMGNDADKE